VSVSTVSKALNGYSDISDRTRELVIKTANEIGYFPNANARALKLKKTYNIGVLFNTFTNLGLKNEYFAHILAAFKDEAAQNGYDITFIEHYLGRRKMTYLEHCQFRHFDGLCIACADYESDEVIKLVNSDLPVVTIDYAFPKSYSIISDNYNGMKQLTNYIIHQGHTDIAFIHGTKQSLVTKNRLNGFLDAMSESGHKAKEEFVVESIYRNSAAAEDRAARLLLNNKRPTCIIAPDDLSATGVLSAIRKQGLQPVKDVSLAGYDGMDANLFVGAKLTTVRQERESIGKEAARKLIQLIDNEDNISLETVFIKQTLIIGNSVKKIKQP
jgi:DNA-binding LacI/PurR family transcriptional regulator